MKYLAIPVVILLFVVISFGQAKKFKVHIILGGDTNLQTELKTYLSREINLLPDVAVTPDGEFVLYLAGISNQLGDGKVLGYTLNAIYLQPTLKSDRTVVPVFLDSSLFFGGEQDLEKLSKDVVGDFTTKILEPRRKMSPKYK